MSIAQAILEIYPGLDPTRDFEVRDDGDGKPYLASWDNPNPRPTERQLADAELPAAKTRKRAEMQAAFARECEADFGPTPWIAVGVLASSPTDARVTSLKTRATKLRDRLASVEGATTVAGVEAVRW